MITPIRPAVRWIHLREGYGCPPDDNIRKRWDAMLMSGRYKVVESDASPTGPWTDAEMRDDGTVVCRMRYSKLAPKEM
jgi:hypothetical protein